MLKSKFFTVSEWNSDHRLATPYPVEWEERWLVLANVLDAIRETAGHAIRVTPNGGYRNEAMNRAIGGKRFSQHIDGRAADIVCAKLPASELHRLISDLYRAGSIPSLGGLGLYPRFVHVDVRPKSKSGIIARWDESANIARIG